MPMPMRWNIYYHCTVCQRAYRAEQITTNEPPERTAILQGHCEVCTTNISRTCMSCGISGENRPLYQACRVASHGDLRICAECGTVCVQCQHRFAPGHGMSISGSDSRPVFVCSDECAAAFQDRLERDNRGVTEALPDTTFTRLASNRKVGFEIEFLTPEGIYGNLKKLGVVKGDGSIEPTQSQQDDDFGGLEFASRPARGDALLDYIAAVCDEMNRIGAEVNRTCGLHVHIDMSSTRASTTKLRAAIEAWAVFEPLFLGMVAPSRRSNTYCKHVRGVDFDTLLYDRYRTLNVCAYNKFKTLEVRLHHSTTNKEQITGWILMLIHFFDAWESELAEGNRYTFSGEDRDRLIYFFKRIKLPKPLKRQAIQRIKYYNRTRSTAAVILTKQKKHIGRRQGNV